MNIIYTLFWIYLTTLTILIPAFGAEQWSPYADQKHLKACYEFFDGLYNPQKIEIKKKQKNDCLNPVGKNWSVSTANENYSKFQAEQFLLRRRYFDLDFFTNRSTELIKSNTFKLSPGVQKSVFFFSLFQAKVPTLFLREERFSHLPHSFKVAKDISSLEAAISELKIIAMGGEIASRGMEVFPLLSDKRFEEFMSELQAVLVNVDVYTKPYHHKGHSLSLPAWRLLHRAGFVFDDVKESLAFKEIVDFATVSLDNLKFFFSFCNESVLSLECFPLLYSPTVRDLRKAIFTHWMAKDRGGFLILQTGSNKLNPLLQKYDHEITSTRLYKQIMEKDFPTYLEDLFFLQSLFAPHFRGEPCEFISLPDFKESVKKFEEYFDDHHYRMLFKGLFGKDVSKGHFLKIQNDVHSTINQNLQINEPYFPNKTYLKEHFEEGLTTLLNGPAKIPLHGSQFDVFVAASTPDAAQLILTWNQLLLKENKLSKIGYVNYHGMPIAAWRFLHGKPYPAENFTWQELADIVYERYTAKGSLVEFLRYFEKKVKDTLIDNTWAQRTLRTREEIIRYHALHHPEEYRQAQKAKLVEQKLAKQIRVALKKLRTPVQADTLQENKEEVPTPTTIENILEFSSIEEPTSSTLLVEETPAEMLEEALDTQPIQAIEESFEVPAKDPEEISVITTEDTQELPSIDEPVPTFVVEENPSVTTVKEPEFSEPIQTMEAFASDNTPSTKEKKKPKKRRPRNPRQRQKKVVPLSELKTMLPIQLMADSPVQSHVPANEIKPDKPNLIIDLEDLSESEDEDCIVLFDDKRPDIDFPPGQSDLLKLHLNLLLSTPITSPEWETYFAGLFKDFVPANLVEEFLQNHRECQALDTAYQNEYRLCRDYLFNGRYLIGRLQALTNRDELFPHIRQYEYVETVLSHYDRAPKIGLFDNPCMDFCRDQVDLMRRLEDFPNLSANEQARYSANKNSILLSFQYLLSWVVGEKCNLLKNADFCNRMIPLLYQCDEALTKALASKQRAQH